MNKNKIILIDAVDCFVSEIGEINIPLQQLLDGYANKKIIVTNALDEMISKFGLDKVPYEVFSLKKNPMKTDSEYFKILMSEKNLAINDIVYIEHSSETVQAAESLGIKSYFYNSDKTDLLAVKMFSDVELSI